MSWKTILLILGVVCSVVLVILSVLTHNEKIHLEQIYAMVFFMSGIVCFICTVVAFVARIFCETPKARGNAAARPDVPAVPAGNAPQQQDADEVSEDAKEDEAAPDRCKPKAPLPPSPETIKVLSGKRYGKDSEDDEESEDEDSKTTAGSCPAKKTPNEDLNPTVPSPQGDPEKIPTRSDDAFGEPMHEAMDESSDDPALSDPDDPSVTDLEVDPSLVDPEVDPSPIDLDTDIEVQNASPSDPDFNPSLIDPDVKDQFPIDPEVHSSLIDQEIKDPSTTDSEVDPSLSDPEVKESSTSDIGALEPATVYPAANNPSPTDPEEPDSVKPESVGLLSEEPTNKLNQQTIHSQLI